MGTILSTENLNKAFGNRKVIDNLNLSVFEGDIYGFLGKNGQGKTTLIRLVTGLIFADSGQISVCDLDLKSHFIDAISKIGVIVETPAFYEYLSGYDNLKLMANLVPNINRDSISEALNMVGLYERSKDKVKCYSLGMKQRLGIANALLHSPKIVILDEPSNGLDPQGMKEIKDLIMRLNREKKMTFFISSHLLHDIEQICNRIGIIDNGRLLIETDMSSVRLKNKSLEELFFQTTGM